jgi:hypothetical protein
MFITSFGADNEDNENENIEDLLPKKANKQQNETLLNFKSLKENTKFSLLRSTHSRSKSKSPVLNEKILNKKFDFFALFFILSCYFANNSILIIFFFQ